jgi:hypothetical protein
MKHTILKLCVLLFLAGCYGPNMDDRVSAPPPAEATRYWLWDSLEDEAPPCPQGNVKEWKVLLAPVVRIVCGYCTCGPAQWQVPHTVTAFSGADCAGMPSGRLEAGGDWDGSSYVTETPIPDADVASVRYELPTLAPCTPSPTPRAPTEEGFSRMCATRDESEDLQGFKLCRAPEANGDCDPATPSYRLLSIAESDNQTCSPCECSEPTGSSVVDFVLYKDPERTDQLNRAVYESTDESLCRNVASGPLVSMSAYVSPRTPARCEPGAPVLEVLGDLEVRSTGLCCEK